MVESVIPMLDSSYQTKQVGLTRSLKFYLTDRLTGYCTPNTISELY